MTKYISHEQVKSKTAWINSTEQDLELRKTLAWKALNGMVSVWNSNLPQQIKLGFFFRLQ